MQSSNPLQSWRKRAGLTQEQAAARIGVSLRNYVRWEGGKRPSKLGLAAIEAAMGAPLSGERESGQQ